MGKCLVVDDDELMRTCVASMLADMGHDVVLAEDGLEALLTYHALRGELCLAVMDVLMPRMDGIAATQVMKAADPLFRVILMSGQAPPAAQADAFITKPFSRQAFVETVERVLGTAAPEERQLPGTASS